MTIIELSEGTLERKNVKQRKRTSLQISENRGKEPRQISPQVTSIRPVKKDDFNLRPNTNFQHVQF